MTPLLDGYSLATPHTLSEALAMLGAAPDVRPFAGGTDLMVQLEAGHLPSGRYVNLWGLRELQGIAELPDGIAIGALTTYTSLRQSSMLARDWPMLVDAAAETGGVATQNRGTIGGNIANASPAADTPPALLVYDAELELLSSAGARRIAYRTFHTGYKKMDLGPGEIISRILLPRRTGGWRDFYRKVGTRRAQAISKVCMAASIAVDEAGLAQSRLALGSVAPFVLRCVAAEGAVNGRRLDDRVIADAQAALARDISPIDDIRSTARYRRRVAQNLLGEFLRGTTAPSSA